MDTEEQAGFVYELSAAIKQGAFSRMAIALGECNKNNLRGGNQF